ncbi:MAG TPA: hypothetical protein VMW91_06005 [Desulfosporosinus sp.]|nr:hypothetical protein [Desulfosporosinus sp.]
MAKFYVLSGEIKWVGKAKNQLKACMMAIASLKENAESDHFFYVDERGFRGDTASTKIPTSYIYDRMLESEEEEE